MRKALVLIAALFMGMTAHAAQTQPTQRETVAACLVLEAGCDGTRGMTAVAWVIKNRCTDSGMTPLGVVMERRQFATMSRGAAFAYNKARKSSAWPAACAVYDRYMRGTLGKDITGGARFFESYGFKHKPRWTRKLKRTIVVGRNWFYKSL